MAVVQGNTCQGQLFERKGVMLGAQIERNGGSTRSTLENLRVPPLAPPRPKDQLATTLTPHP